MAAKTVDIGDMRERVALHSPSPSLDEIGGLEQSWSVFATVWARVTPASNREWWHREQTQASGGWRVTIRYRSDVTTKHRVVWRGLTLEVTGIDNTDERRRFLTLTCEERTAA